MTAEQPAVRTGSGPEEGALEIGAHRPLDLDGDGVWLVESGRVDVFMVARDGGGLSGGRHPLVRVEGGQAVFGLFRPTGDPHASGMIGVGRFDTRVRRLPLEDAPLELLEGWIRALVTTISAIPPKRCAELQPGAVVDLPVGESARIAAEVAWIAHAGGISHLCGEPGLVMDERLVPLARGAWLRGHEAARIEVLDTRAAVGRGELRQALARLHDLVLCHAHSSLAARREDQRRRLHEETAERRRHMESALRRVVGAVEAVPAEEVPVDPGQTQTDLLLAACRVLGRAASIQVVEPRRSDAESMRDPLSRIAASSSFGTRTVTLDGAWWEADHGPLLARRTADQSPVALVPSARGRYRLHDPARGTSEPVTVATAGELEAAAVTLYRPFPARSLHMRDVVRFGLRGRWRDVAVVVAIGVASGLLATVPPIASGLLIDSVIPGAERSQLLQLTVILSTCALVTAMLNVTQTLAFVRIETAMSAAVQAAVWDRLLRLPVPFFRKYAAGALAHRAMAVDSVRQTVSGAVISGGLSGLFSVFNLALLYTYDPHLAVRATAMIAIAVGATVLVGVAKRYRQKDVAPIQSKAAGIVLQLLTGISKLRVCGAESAAFAIWADLFSRQRRMRFALRRIGAQFAAFNACFPIVACMVIFSGALDAGPGTARLSTGSFVGFLAAFTACLTATQAVGAAGLQLLAAAPAVQLAQPILRATPEVSPGKGDPGEIVGEIEVQHLTFRYEPSGPVVLQDLCFRAAAGELVAVVGTSGSGKSTLLRLLLGFEQAESGAIYLDGRELAGLDIHAVRRQIGVVLQSGGLMPGDIYTNIAGGTTINLQAAWDAAEMAGLADEIRRLPMGMHTIIDQRGSTLSGGQRQRLMIARAVVNRPRVLLFDEATSALDNRTQELVSRSLGHLQATRLVVAHRLSTITHADRILVMDRGRIVETGTYSALIAQNGTFARLARRQIA